ncbi:RNA-binding protein [Methylocapsa sp. S129]|uniref:RNA-binding protein n=1 Tax=Methylocapsa sp. S129 TaxID=1641869 RepID=UPI001AEF0636|nr:RNA-binding protein [Methylocapsa sp. S129]
MGARSKPDKRGSERTCVVTGEKGPPEGMIHFALSPGGDVVPDLRRKLPGRGVWTKLSSAIVAEAVRKQAFSRGFKTKAAAPPDLAAKLDSMIEQDALQFLSIVNKAGLIVTGAAKVEAAIRGGDILALIHALDGSPDGTAKLERIVRGRFGDAADRIARINLFSSSQLDLALGRTNVIHAALGAGEASAAFLYRARRLAQYRSNGEGVPPIAAMTDDGGEPIVEAEQTDGQSPGTWKDA